MKNSKLAIALPGKTHSHSELCKILSFTESVFEEGKKSNRWIWTLLGIMKVSDYLWYAAGLAFIDRSKCFSQEIKYVFLPFLAQAPNERPVFSMNQFTAVFYEEQPIGKVLSFTEASRNGLNNINAPIWSLHKCFAVDYMTFSAGCFNLL